MTTTPEQFRARTKQSATRTIRLIESLPNSKAADVIGRQLLRSATSVGANYRAACRARSSAEFRSKMGIVEEEADESVYWLELLIEAKIVRAELLRNLIDEANEIAAMVVSSINTTRHRKSNSETQRK